VVERVRADQTPFVVAFTTSRRSWRPWRQASIKAMVDAGLNVILASDDPGMFPTTLAQEYQIASSSLQLDNSTLRAMSLAGVEASWVSEPEKMLMRERFVREFDALDQESHN